MPSDAPPDCLACGTCCFSELPRYVRVFGDDHARLGDDADALTVFHGTECYMAMSDGHCAALRVDRAQRAFVCTIYDRRPRTCRELDRGSPECAGELASKADRAARALGAAEAAAGRSLIPQ